MADQTSSEPRSVRARRMVADVEQALHTQTPAQISAAVEFAEYQKEFPKLFQLLLGGAYSREIMETMLQQLERVERGASSQHDASVAVGSLLVNRIVKPQLDAAGVQGGKGKK